MQNKQLPSQGQVEAKLSSIPVDELLRKEMAYYDSATAPVAGERESSVGLFGKSQEELQASAEGQKAPGADINWGQPLEAAPEGPTQAVEDFKMGPKLSGSQKKGIHAQLLNSVFGENVEKVDEMVKMLGKRVIDPRDPMQGADAEQELMRTIFEDIINGGAK
jgi:hypothetical protein